MISNLIGGFTSTVTIIAFCCMCLYYFSDVKTKYGWKPFIVALALIMIGTEWVKELPRIAAECLWIFVIYSCMYMATKVKGLKLNFQLLGYVFSWMIIDLFIKAILGIIMVSIIPNGFDINGGNGIYDYVFLFIIVVIEWTIILTIARGQDKKIVLKSVSKVLSTSTNNIIGPLWSPWILKFPKGPKKRG